MTLYADSNGQILGKFTIPAGVLAGSKLVQYYGASGAYAETLFTGRGVVQLRELQWIPYASYYDGGGGGVTLTYGGAGVDPLAQTFMVSEDTMCGGARFQFTAQGATDVAVQIREVQNGVPTNTILAQAVKTAATLTINSTNTQSWTTFEWVPVMLEKGVQYAVSIACNDSTTAIRTAELGKYDALNQKWMTAQPYTTGVLLSSSDGVTWSPDQFKDMTFQLLTPTFSGGPSYTREYDLDPVSVTDCDYLTVLAAVWRPNSDCQCLFEITIDPGGPAEAVYTVTEGQPLTLPATFTGDIAWKVLLTGTATASPWVFRSLQLAAGTSQTTGSYVTRAIPCNSDGSDIYVICTSLLPSPATVTFYVQTGVDGDGDPTWSSAMSLQAGQTTLVSTVGGSWYEKVYKYAGLSGVTQTRVKAVMTGTAQARPQLRNLQVYVKDG